MPDEEPIKPETPSTEEESGGQSLELEGLRKALEEQTARTESTLNNWKRTQADFENYKKKAEQDKQENAVFANAALVASLLPILDDLQRALDNIDPTMQELTWVEGLKLVHRKLLATLEGQGLAVIQTEGQMFDPRYHEALLHAPGKEGAVVGELQRGYKFKDRVIRPALVKVGNGEQAAKAG